MLKKNIVDFFTHWEFFTSFISSNQNLQYLPLNIPWLPTMMLPFSVYVWIEMELTEVFVHTESLRILLPYRLISILYSGWLLEPSLYANLTKVWMVNRSNLPTTDRGFQCHLCPVETPSQLILQNVTCLNPACYHSNQSENLTKEKFIKEN